MKVGSFELRKPTCKNWKLVKAETCLKALNTQVRDPKTLQTVVIFPQGSLASEKRRKLTFSADYFIIFKLGIFSQQLDWNKKILFGIVNESLFRPQIKPKRNTANQQ